MPSEPEDAVELTEVEHWIGVYAEFLCGLTGLGTNTLTPELLARIMATDVRLRWWQRRREELGTPG